MLNQKPSIGRTVIFNHPGSADGLHAPKQSPAIIQKVNDDGTVELFVMSVYGGIFFNHNVKQVENTETPINQQAPAAVASRWNWPERVE